MCISTVNAANMDSNGTDTIVSASDNITITNNNDIISADNSTNIILSDSSNLGSFKDLSDEINKGQNITLKKDYEFKVDSNSADATLINGIIIDKSITINGNGHSIDGKALARIFHITADNVILNNITIKNAAINNTCSHINSTDSNVNITMGNGAGILWTGNNGILNNSIIIGNTIYNNVTFWNTTDTNVNYYIGNGAGVYWSGKAGKIENTEFKDNLIKYDIIFKYNVNSNKDVLRVVANGAAAYTSSSDMIIRKSNFINNIVNGTYDDTDDEGFSSNSESSVLNVGSYFRFAGAVYVVGEYISISQSSFVNNFANAGGAVYINSTGASISDSIFVSNMANSTGGAIYVGGNANAYSEIVISNSNFVNNTALSSAGAVYIAFYGSSIENSNFTDNTAIEGSAGAIYWTGNWGSLTASNFVNNSAVNGNGGAIYWAGGNGVVSYSNFTNNSAFVANDIYSSVETLNSNNNVFVGSYAFIDNRVLEGYQFLTIKKGYDEKVVIANVSINNGEWNYLVNIDAKNSNNVRLFLDEISRGIYTVNITFSSDNNVYKNIRSTFEILGGDYELYVDNSTNGVGSKSNPANLTYALENIPSGGKIILLPGIYANITVE